MVKALLLALLVATICGTVIAAPATTAAPAVHPDDDGQPPLEDPNARSERSTNLSHVTGAARKIQMFIKNRHLQLLPDGTVNGTTDDTSAFTILQRSTVGIGQIKIQGVATCQYLCMDACGLLYGSREFGDECIFNETIEQTNYNTYASSKYSNERRTYYLALNRRGQPRKVVIRVRHQLGRLSSYTRVLTRTVSPELMLHPLRLGHVCPPAPAATAATGPRPNGPRCRKKKKKRKKKKRKCGGGGDDDDAPAPPRCHQQQRAHRLCDSDECQRNSGAPAKKRHKAHSERPVVSVPKKKKKNKKGVRKRPEQVESQEATTTTVAPPTSTPPPDDAMSDEDYPVDFAVDSSTHDWEDATGVPDVSMVVNDARPSNAHTDSD